MAKTENLIEEMLGKPEKLSSSELDWIKKIDKTTSRFSSLQFTTKQAEVIQGIYNKFKSR